jgi:16S rRNA (cytosine967-C5)-methyltransferase
MRERQRRPPPPNERTPPPTRRTPRSAPLPRALTLVALREIDRGDKLSNRALARVLDDHPELDRRDRGLVTTLVYGVLRAQRRLDHVIDSFAKDKSRLVDVPRYLLRIAAFEILELDRPVHIASAEAVRVARTLAGGERLVGLITAISRRVATEGRAILDRLDAQALDPARPSLAIPALAIRYSCPDWIVERWLATLGAEDTRARLAALTVPPALDLRVDTSKLPRDEAMARLRDELPEAEIEPLTGTPSGLRLRHAGDVFHGVLHDAGLISVQALGSQRAALVLAPQPGERVLDLCAGIGVKTLQLAELMHRRGVLVAIEPDEHRVRTLRETLERGGVEGGALAVRVVHGDARQVGLDRLGTPFDAVLVDAPCSGLGNLARHPELRWRRSLADLGDRAALQGSLLRHAAASTRVGGRIVYAVCSLEPEEGPAVVEAFLDAPEGAAWRAVATEAITPELHGSDGFWLARLERSA